MKNLIITIAILLSVFVSKAQDFQKTDAYQITELIEDKETTDSNTVYLVRTKDTSEKLASFTIEEDDTFEGVFITTLANPGLENIDEVLKVEVAYIGCCASVETFYYMVTENGTLLALPKLDNTFCENSEPAFQYIFPNQKFGQPKMILATKSFYNQEFEIDYVSLLQSYSWGDDDLMAGEALAQNFKD